jgi:transcriptional regulator GlxA family with amidase domain
MYRSIEERFTDPNFSTATLASDADPSVRSVQAIFSDGGASPAAEIRRLRLNHARALLEHGHSVQTACQASGFLDPGTFARTYRDRFGFAPSHTSHTGIA